MIVEHEVQCWTIKDGKFYKSINSTTLLIRQFCWSYMQWWSLGTWSWDGLSLEGFRPHLGLEGYRSRSQAWDFEYCKDIA